MREQENMPRPGTSKENPIKVTQEELDTYLLSGTDDNNHLTPETRDFLREKGILLDGPSVWVQVEGGKTYPMMTKESDLGTQDPGLEDQMD
jgi:hypothetical protein